MYGDIDGDKEVKVGDALMALQAAVGKIALGDEALAAADVDGKEGVSVADALCILQYAVGKIQKFPPNSNYIFTAARKLGRLFELFRFTKGIFRVRILLL